MSDDNGQRAPLHWQDAFSSPSWQIPELDEAVLAPPLEDYGLTDFRAPRDLPKPPDVDEILRGEYTGWIPVIREGESLEQVQAREQSVAAADVSVAAEIRQVSGSVDQAEVAQAAEDAQQPVSYSPWLAVETFEYGFQAQHEVPAQVAPIPPVQPTTQPTVHAEPKPVSRPEPVTRVEPVQVEPTPVATTAPVQPPTVEQVGQSDDFDNTFDTSAWNSTEASSSQTTPRPTQSIDAKFVADATAPADHSLELVIMRDEIQDLRNRLDSSQKLVEEMMHKLANLAELALRSRM